MITFNSLPKFTRIRPAGTFFNTAHNATSITLITIEFLSESTSWASHGKQKNNFKTYISMITLYIVISNSK